MSSKNKSKQPQGTSTNETTLDPMGEEMVVAPSLNAVLIADESIAPSIEAVLEATAKTPRVAKIGDMVLFHKNGDHEGELLSFPAVVVKVKSPGACELQIFRGTFTECVTKAPFMEEPTAGYWSFRD